MWEDVISSGNRWGETIGVYFFLLCLQTSGVFVFLMQVEMVLGMSNMYVTVCVHIAPNLEVTPKITKMSQKGQGRNGVLAGIFSGVSNMRGFT